MAENNNDKKMFSSLSKMIADTLDMTVRLMPGGAAEILKMVREMWNVPLADQAAWIKTKGRRDWVDLWISRGWFDQDDKDALMNQPSLGLIGDSIFFTASHIMLWFNYLTTYVTMVSGTQVQNLAAKHSPTPPPAGAMLRGALIAPELHDQYVNGLKRGGWSDADIRLMFISQYALYDVTTTRTLFLRKAITEELMFERLREHGFTDTRIKELIQTWEVIPPVNEILRIVAKEGFEPEAIAQLGLDQEFPTDQMEHMSAQGFSRFWAEKEWIAHWDPPSIGQTFEMLHRGEVDLEFVAAMFRVHEIPPKARQPLLNIAYNPYTRVDVRRMHDLGVIDDAGLLRAYLDIGYDQEKAEAMVLFTLKYNQDENRALSKGEILRGYSKLGTDRQTTLDLLLTIGYSADQAEYFISLQDLERIQDEIEEEIVIIREKYEANLLTQSQALQSLVTLQLPSDKISTLIRRWTIFKSLDVALPSKTDLGKFYKAGKISKERYHSMLVQLRYTPEIAQMYIDLLEPTRKE